MRKFLNLFMLTLLVVLGRGTAWADTEETPTTVTIPTEMGKYIATTNSTTTGTINKNDNGGLGSIYKEATATFALNSTEDLENVYLTFMTASNNGDSNPTVQVDITGADNYTYTKKVDIPGTGNWGFSSGTKHVLFLENLPSGDISLKFTFNNDQGYVCNLGNIAFYQGSQYTQEPNAYLDLNSAVLSGARVEDNSSAQGGKQIGYLSNGTSTTFDFYVTAAGVYNLCMGMYYYGDGTMNVKIIDAKTEKAEVNQDVAITSDFCKGYDKEVAILLNAPLASGVKIMKLSFTTSASYLMNYANLRLTALSHTLSVSDAKFATLVLPFDATIPEGAKVYKLTAVDEKNIIKCENVSGTLPANTPVLVKAEKGNYIFAASKTAEKEETPKAGLLTGAWDATTTVPANSYVLQKQNDKVAFYKVASANSITLKANQAYLTVNNTSGSSSAKALSFDFDTDETTGVELVPATDVTPDAPIYNLQGMKVSKDNLPKVYIMNGKKYISK